MSNEEVAQRIADEVREAIRSHTMGSDRSRQQAEHRIGISEIGACRSYLARMITQQPYDDPSGDIKLPAFIGSAVGDRMESAVHEQFGYETQQTVELTLPSGRVVPGHLDVNTGEHIWDIKTVDGLDVVRRDGPSFKNKAQVSGYRKAKIDAGELHPNACAALVYVDRSGKDDSMYVYVMEPFECDAILAEVDQRLDDVEYGVINGVEDVPKDEPLTWCVHCPFFQTCRGDRNPSGVIDDLGHLDAVQRYVDGRELVRQGNSLMKSAKYELDGVSGSTGEYAVSWTHMNETKVESFTRSATDRMDVRKVKR
jgi:hypothetical protein